jgi:phosphoribosylformylglycinamidine cyclo-ligase
MPEGESGSLPEDHAPNTGERGGRPGVDRARGTSSGGTVAVGPFCQGLLTCPFQEAPLNPADPAQPDSNSANPERATVSAGADGSAYGRLGVSATKDDVHAAVKATDAGLFPGAFCRIGTDVLGGDPAWCNVLHADDAGTKAIVAYLAFRESGDPAAFAGLAHDAFVMNLDDLLAIGAVDRFLLSNTINRNSFVVPGSAIKAIIGGYADIIRRLAPHGIEVVATGGETADMNDSVRTLVVGANLATRMRRDRVIDNARIRPGLVIVGLSSTGRAEWEDAENSGIGDNGLTLARHALLAKEYLTRYPESADPGVDRELACRGPFKLSDPLPGTAMTVGQALLSPTRTYAPAVRRMLDRHFSAVRGIVHCTGGGQTKCLHFGRGIRYVKDQLFPVPPLFAAIARHGGVPAREMYLTFNMGHRLELFVEPNAADELVAIASDLGIAGRIVGRTEAATGPINELTLTTPSGETFDYRGRE